MIHIKRLSLALTMFVFALPFGLVSAVFKSVSYGLDEITGAIITGLNAVFSDKKEVEAFMEFVQNSDRDEEDQGNGSN